MFTATLPGPVPVWDGMRLVVVDLNGKNLRVAGGGVVVAERLSGLPERLFEFLEAYLQGVHPLVD